jgi:malate dehydrogenase (oxaloacetate-decarboxylating)(NADP+)
MFQTRSAAPTAWKGLSFGREYLIPTLFDTRVLVWEASAVAEAAMRTGVAQEPVDLVAYREQLESRLGKAHEVERSMIHKAQANPKQVVFPEGENEKVLRACHSLVEEKIAKPILLGNSTAIQARAKELGLSLKGMKIVNPGESELREFYIQELFRLRQRRGVTLNEAQTLINDRNVFGSMMVHMGDADALVSGVTQHFSDTIRPALQIVRMREGFHRVSGCYVLITHKGDVLFLADASVNIEPTAEDLVEIALCTAHLARRFDVHPRVAILSFSSFGSVDHPICTKVRKAVELLHFADPTLIVDGEIMADEALSPEIIEQSYPFSALKGGANVLIFPDLASANIACKLVAKIGGCETIGPILMGMSRPVHVLHRGAQVEEIVDVAAIAVVDAQENESYLQLRKAEENAESVTVED